MQRFLRLPIEKKILLLTCATMVGLGLYRGYDYHVTGFFVADEFGYAFDAIYGYIYGNRWFFGSMNSAIFRLFNITTVDGYALLLPFYLIFWSCLTLYLFYLLMKSLKYDGITIALSLFTSLFLVSFVLLSQGFLTEPVGLALTLLGSLLLVKFAGRSSNSFSLLLYPLAASLCFVAATYTREPYSIFLILGFVAVFLGSRGAGGRHSGGPRKEVVYLTASILIFAIPSAVFLQYPNHDLADSIGMVIADFANLFSHPGGIQPPVIATTAAPVYTSLPARLLNTGEIFAFGLVLGWGPILLGLLLLSLFFILRKTRGLDSQSRVVLFLSVLALASYLIVSYIFSVDPTFLSFKNYSTIIRFSDTALPAYFLIAPIGIAAIARKKRFRRGLVAALLAFLVAAVPLYEAYASSSFDYMGGNPFSIDYRTSAAQIRDYFLTHQSEGPFYVIGIPSGWIFTPGVEDLHGVQIFAPSPIPVILSHVGLFYERLFIPYLQYDDFVAHRWSTIYVYGANITGAYDQDPGYAIQFINPGAHMNATNPPPFTVVSRQTIFRSPNTIFVEVQLSWK